MNALLPLPFVVPLLAAGLLLVLPDRPAARRALTLAAVAGAAGAAVALLAATADGTVLASVLGGFPPGVSVVLAADALSSTMVLVSGVLTVACLAFAAATDADRHPLFAPLALVLLAGVNGAYLTADLFNLFVFIEVMLVPSYVLLVLGTREPGAGRLGAARLYVTVNLLASTLFLAGIGLVYATAGTVNLGRLAGAAAADPAVAVAFVPVLLALAVKAALVPLHGWLPRAYSAAPAAVTALFSGLLTKVGVYALMRLYAVVFDGDPALRPLLLTVAVLTMVVGVLGALGAGGLRPVLTFHMVSQIGYLVVGLALFTRAGLAAAVFFLVQYVLVKAALLLVAGAVEHTHGTGELARLSGLAYVHPVLAAVFAVAALALAGFPPTSGFVAKLALVRAAVEDSSYVAAGFAVGVSLITLLSMLKIWNGIFWRDADRDVDPEGGIEPGAEVRTRLRAPMVAPALVLALAAVVLGVGGQPLLALADTAAAGLVDTTAYVAAVGG